MDSIQGPVTAPRMMPPVEPRPALDPDVSGSRPEGASLPAAPIPSDTRPGQAGPLADATSPGAPPGVDPELWSVLTSEEREFFSVAHALGPVTYGPQPGSSKQASLPRGRRLDVRI